MTETDVDVQESDFAACGCKQDEVESNHDVVECRNLRNTENLERVARIFADREDAQRRVESDAARSRGANVLSDVLEPTDEAPNPDAALAAVRRAADDAKTTWGATLLATNSLGDRVSALRICASEWLKVGVAVPPSLCVDLFYALCFAPDLFKGRSMTTERIAPKRANVLAGELLKELNNSDSACGLSQPQLRALSPLLRALAEGGPPGHTGFSRAIPPRPTRENAHQTFVTRLIVQFVLKFSPKPMYAAVAGLASAAVFDPEFPDAIVSEGAVRKATELARRELS